MLASILAAILALLKAIPIFDRWFTTPPIVKEQEELEKLRAEMDDFKKTGRPPK